MSVRKPYLSVIIPVHNEAKRLSLTLVDVDRHLSKGKYTYEILVIDNGSIDGTLDIAKKFTKMISNLRVLEAGEGVGIGGTLRLGMLEAGGRYKLFMEADNSTTIDHFEKMIPFFKEGYEVVIGSRSMKDSKLNPPKPIIRRLIDNLGGFLIRALFFIGIKDTQCGFKCFSIDAADKVFRLQKTKSWAFNVEVLILSKKNGYKIGEIPVSWKNDPESRASIGEYLKIFSELLEVRWWLWRNTYKIRRK